MSVMKNLRDCSFGYLILPVVLGQDDHAFCADQLACGGLVGSSQVEEIVGRAAWLAFTHQVVILCFADNLAAMGDGLHIVLILMARLVQCVLAITVSLPQASFFWVVEPLDPDHHAGAPGLPEALYSSYIGQLWPTW